MQETNSDLILVKVKGNTYTVRNDVDTINCYDKELRTTLIKTLIIPETVKSIEVPYMVADFESFKVDENNPYFASRDGVLYSKDNKILIAYPRSKPDNDFTIPAEVEIVADDAFRRNLYLENITISSNVKQLGNYAFYSCRRLTNLTLSEGLETIGRSCFSFSYKINIISIPTTVTQLFTSVLDSWHCIEIPDTVQNLINDDGSVSDSIILLHDNPVVSNYVASTDCSLVSGYTVDDSGNIWSTDGVLIRFSPHYKDKTYTLPPHATGILEQAFVGSSVKVIKCKQGHEVELMFSYPPRYTPEFDTPIKSKEFSVSDHDTIYPAILQEYDPSMIHELDLQAGIHYDDNDDGNWMGIENNDD